MSPPTAYPTLASRAWRRLHDLPWRFAALRDRVLPGLFAELLPVVQPYSMCSEARLRSLHRAVRSVVRRGVAGDLVECGAARGGSALLLALTAARLGQRRRTWVFDTFAGLPQPTLADPDYDEARRYVGTCRGELAELEALFAAAGVREQVVFVKGLFQDTLPVSPVGTIAVLHLDGDWYDSVRVCLDHLYARVAPGGVIQIDDYGHWAGARKAVDEFFERRGFRPRLRYVDYTGRTLRKPHPVP